MKALTVQQPWAWAIVHGGKDVENRTQAWGYRGPLAIHAGARWSTRGAGVVPSLLVGDDVRTAYDGLFSLGGSPGGEVGAIIGVVDLVDVHHQVGSGSRNDCCESPWAEPWHEHMGALVHLVLANPRPLDVPIPAKGRLGLWTPDADVLEQLHASGVNQA